VLGSMTVQPTGEPRRFYQKNLAMSTISRKGRTEQMEPRQRQFTSAEAVDYCELPSMAALKYHVYIAKNLTIDRRDTAKRRIYFYQSTLDRFNKNKRPVGRPSKNDRAKS